MRQFEGHAGTAQLFKWVAAARLIWVQDGNSGGHTRGRIRQVVVGDDQVQPAAGSLLRGGKGTDARVHRDHQAHPFGSGIGDARFPHAIALADAVRDVKSHICNDAHGNSRALQCRLQQHRGYGAIDVIVAVDEDGLMPAQR